MRLYLLFVSPDIRNLIANLNQTCLKTKVESYGDKVTGFHDKGMPKAGSNNTCLAVVTTDSILKKDLRNHLLQPLQMKLSKNQRYFAAFLLHFCNIN